MDLVEDFCFKLIAFTKKKTHETIKKELLNSSKENDNVEESGLNETANETDNTQEITLLIHSTYLKISLYKFLNKHPALRKSTLSSSYFRDNFKGITIALYFYPLASIFSSS